MELSRAQHKAFLYKIIALQADGSPRRHPLEKLDVAIAASKKLAEGSKTTEQGMIFVDKPVEFNPEEWVFLKDQLGQVTEVSLVEGETLQELKKLFDKE